MNQIWVLGQGYHNIDVYNSHVGDRRNDSQGIHGVLVLGSRYEDVTSQGRHYIVV